MEQVLAMESLLRALRGALCVLETESPNRISVHNALCYAEQCRRGELDSPTRRALLRRSAAHLRQADLLCDDALEGEVLATTRWAMTAALFEMGGVGEGSPAERPRVS